MIFTLFLSMGPVTFLWSPVSGFIALSSLSFPFLIFLIFFLVHVTLLQCFYNPLAYDKNYRIFKACVLPFCTCTHKWDLGYNRIQRTFVQFAQNWTPEMSGCGTKPSTQQSPSHALTLLDHARLTAVVLQAVFN